MGVRESLLADIARQLGRPEGRVGTLVSRGLNLANRSLVKAAVEATGLQRGQTGADLGFGGGVGLRPMLDRVGSEGAVHGVEISRTMLRQAARRFRKDEAAGRLVLSEGSLTALPLADASLDAALTANTVYFVNDLSPVCAELARVVRPGGRAVVAASDPTYVADAPDAAYGFKAWPARDIIEALEHAGFVDVRDIRLGTGDRVTHVIVAYRA